MKIFFLKTLWLLLITFGSKNLLADNESNFSFFYTYESNANDYIAGIGIEKITKDQFSNLGFAVSTSINAAEVLTKRGYREDYISWQASIKFGFFSKISIYGEVGIDLTEAIFYDFRHDNGRYHHASENHFYEDDVDTFAGVGAGVNLNILSIEAFSRFRKIDSRFWQAESEVFSGIRFSLNF